uniref:Nudix hydrolase domain-containing protein n=1 Tax=Meloidogyne hapla TaxID=6305 RepID=A0A1I8BS97_MELHA
MVKVKIIKNLIKEISLNQTKGKLVFIRNLGEELVKKEFEEYKNKNFKEQVIEQNNFINQMKEKSKIFEKDDDYRSSNDKAKRDCHMIIGNLCIIYNTKLKYTPKEVIGNHLVNGFLPASNWPKPGIPLDAVWHEGSHCSFYGKYLLLKSGHPLNPITRTGVKGRGENYFYGPVKGAGGILWLDNEHQLFAFLGVVRGKFEREANRQYTSPGGFLKENETFFLGIIREIIEEALGKGYKEQFSLILESLKVKKLETMKDLVTIVKNLLKEAQKEYEKDPKNQKKRDNFKELLTKLEHMGDGKLVMYGYDDAKDNNSDNSWNESATYAFKIKHEDKRHFKPKPGSDALHSMWLTVYVNEVAEEFEGLGKMTFEEMRKSLSTEKKEVDALIKKLENLQSISFEQMKAKLTEGEKKEVNDVIEKLEYLENISLETIQTHLSEEGKKTVMIEKIKKGVLYEKIKANIAKKELEKEKDVKTAIDGMKSTIFNDRIQYILQNFSICWEEVPEEKEGDTKEKEEKRGTTQCRKMDDSKSVANMENVVRLILVEKYKYKSIDKLLEEIKTESDTKLKKQKILDIFPFFLKKRQHADESKPGSKSPKFDVKGSGSGRHGQRSHGRHGPDHPRT